MNGAPVSPRLLPTVFLYLGAAHALLVGLIVVLKRCNDWLRG